LKCFSVALINGECARQRRRTLRAGGGSTASVAAAKKVADNGLAICGEKQKVKRTYGLTGTAIPAINFEESQSAPRAPGENLIIMLGAVLDNVCGVRSGFLFKRSHLLASFVLATATFRIMEEGQHPVPTRERGRGTSGPSRKRCDQNACVAGNPATDVAQSQNSVPWLEQEREHLRKEKEPKSWLADRATMQNASDHRQLIVELYSSKSHSPMGSASANEPGEPGTETLVLGVRGHSARRKDTMWKGFSKPKRLRSELEALTRNVRAFLRSALLSAGLGRDLGNVRCVARPAQFHLRRGHHRA